MNCKDCKKCGCNKTYQGDCLDILPKLKSESVDLVYLDPPFNSKKDYGEFDDRWKSSEEFIEFLRVRLIELKRVLKPTGSIYLHCDPTESHYIKVMMDKVFGRNNFKNEIVWCYKGAETSKNQLPKKHDILLFYTKSKNYTFNIQYENHSEAQLKRYNIVKKDGTRWANMKGKIRPLGPGKRINDVWPIDFLSNNSKERVGYPTQKPLKLLERIIKASSNKDDVVMDPFMGSGTTLVAAASLERKFIGIDINKNAIKIAKERLK